MNVYWSVIILGLYMFCALSADAQILESSEVTATPVPFKPIALKASDMNNDGNTDLVLMSGASDTVFAVYPGSGDEKFSVPVLIGKELNFNPFDVGDLNRDNIQDLVIAGYWHNGFKVYKGEENISFSSGISYNMGAHGNNVTVTDIDNDGYQDVLGITSGSVTPITLHIFKGDENGDLKFSGKYPTLLSGYLSTYVVDKNGDNLKDVLVTARDWLALYYQQNDGSFLLKYWPLYGAASVIGDINNDNKPDLVLGYSDYGTEDPADSILVLFGETDTLFNLTPLKIMVPGLVPGNMYIHDLDNDTWPELLVSQLNNNGNKTDSLYLFSGRGNNGFQFNKILRAPGAIYNLIITDLKKDSYPEIIVISPESFSVFHNRGSILSAHNPGYQDRTDIYPNPSPNKKMTAMFSLDQSQVVEISIFDISGQQIVTLCKESMPPGTHRVNFSTAPLVPGIYILMIARQKEGRYSEKFIVE